MLDLSWKNYNILKETMFPNLSYSKEHNIFQDLSSMTIMIRYKVY